MPAKFERVDYSKMSLAEIVERKAKKNLPFSELPKEDRQKILRFLRLNDIDKRAFGEKWYDVLSKRFYAEEFVIVEDPSDLDLETKSFASFEEFYDFLKGDIYENACYFGYQFTDEEAEKYSLDFQRLNFDSFEKGTVPTLEWQAMPEDETTIKIDKRYDDRFFVVKKVWLDGDGKPLHCERRHFHHFFDFAHFLEGDLSGANLVLCNGVENLSSVSGLKFDGMKVRSVAASALGLPLKLPSAERLKTDSFETSKLNEAESEENFLLPRPDDEDYSNEIDYVSDIHLQHRFAAYGCKTVEDVNYVVSAIAKAIARFPSRGPNLIGGDTSSDFLTFRSFVSRLHNKADFRNYFFVLGNHELWSFPGHPFDEITKTYRNALEELGMGTMRLVQNNLFYHADFAWKEVNESELSSIGESELREKTRNADTIIFGGLGFAGANEKFNANSGIYGGAINREQEIELSSRFLRLYKKVASALKGRQVVVLTHMPMRDWGGEDLKPEEGFVYVNGHSHRNYFFDDGKKRIFADNQIGYKGKAVSMKKIPIDFGFDWFADYPDGIHEITRDDYCKYYRGIGERLSFNRDFEKLYFLKRNSVYMFFFLDAKGQLKLLNGGRPKNVDGHDLNYFYKHMVNYAESVHLYLAGYSSFQNQVSSEIKRLGGIGRIHGAIVDIDFFNHLYLNCYDGSITAYSANSMTDKDVYKNVGSLLCYERPELYKKYEELASKSGGNGTLIVREGNLAVSDKTVHVEGTEMYRVSRILKSLQFTTKYNLIRVWSDALVKETSEENGKLIVTALLQDLK